ncbi:hypothetical protein HPB48_004023 [Haemaphysalis longicornis]|uniref:Transposable element P transposase-like GTP-binding insertion domain-containing protein n=1 Tax=Haemaphysalis longicornis TaxID=44386 RepID=A0A9J6GIE2_HAELO|nr:hypothetical protein HPB48_004023 [Haemaphysalis longicornis]
MPVKLATQVFSRCMAEGIQFYREQGLHSFVGSEKTQEFTLFLNDLFDALNRRFPAEEIPRNSRDLTILKNGLHWLDSWERELESGAITKDQFLTKNTCEGLRVTLQSTIDLCDNLLRCHNTNMS